MKELLERLKIFEEVNLDAQDVRNILNIANSEDKVLEEDEQLKEHTLQSGLNKYTMYSLDYDIYDVIKYDDYQRYVIDVVYETEDLLPKVILNQLNINEVLKQVKEESYKLNQLCYFLNKFDGDYYYYNLLKVVEYDNTKYAILKEQN